MKTSLLLLAIVCIGVSADARAAFYLAPDGKDENPGTIEKPFGTLEKLVSVLVPGSHGYVRGGVYEVSRAAQWGNIIDVAGVKGTAAQPITIENYPCEKPVFDFKGSSYTGSGAVAIRFIYVDYLHVKGLRFTGYAQNPAGGSTCGLSVFESTHNIFENLEIDHIGGYGIQLGNGADDNLFLNCDAHHIDDRHTGWRNANGFNITGGVKAERNLFDGCRAWFCSDDGFDFFSTDSYVTIKNCWAFWNGYEQAADGSRTPRGDGQGFKLGPHIKRSPPAVDPDYSKTVLRVLTNNLAFENKTCGFDQNSGRMVYQLSGNTSFGNGANGFWFSEYPEVSNVAQNNIAFGDAKEPYFLTNQGENNSWNRAVPLTARDFQSLSSVGMDGPRGADGSLPNLPFLKLVAKTAPPVIKNQSASATVDVAFAYDVMAENDPGEYAASGLPAGLAINSATGKITGTPIAWGDYTSTITARNSAGQASATLSISISGNSAPTIKLTSPANEATFGAPASIALAVSATDSDGKVTQVQFFEGAKLLATDATAPYDFTISNVAVGSYVFSAVAYDNSGNMAYSTASTVNVITLPPPVMADQSATGTVGVQFNYKVAAENNPTFSATGLPPGLALDASTGKITGMPTAWGDYTSTVTAKNPAGEASAALTISISGNSAPVVNLTSPANKAIFVAPASIELSANATDSDGSVAKVEFYDGSTLVATDMTAPYGCTIANVAVGDHTYSAIAYDNSGNISYSKSSTVTVK